MKKLILLLTFACAACSGEPQTGSWAAALGAKKAAPGQQASAGSDTLARIRALAGNSACADDTQCHTLALGAKSCGGPESYLPWSSAHVKADELQALGEKYKEERRAANSNSGMMSDCRFMADPGAVCKAGSCQLGGAPALAR